MPQVAVQRLSPDDWRVWRDLRLAALADTPKAFGSPYAREVGWGEKEWREGLLSEPNAVVVATIDDVPAGIAGALWSHPDVVEIVAMWVTPQSRGQGVGTVLIRWLVDWARERGAREVELCVADGNPGAESLYVRHGFARIDEVRTLESHPDIDVFVLRRSLAGTITP